MSLNVQNIYELSPIQEGILFHTLYAPQSSVYFEQFCRTWPFPELMDFPTFQMAWQKIVEQHPILRSEFHWEGLEKPMQVVRQNVTVPVTFLDWKNIPETEQLAKLQKYLQEQRAIGFRLDKAPLMSVALIQFADNHYEMVWNYHHLLLDGWSNSLVFGEFVECYQAIYTKQEMRWEPRRPYVDYLSWIHKQDFSQSEKYWQKLLHGFDKPTSLGMDYLPHMSENLQENWETHIVTIPKDTTSAIQAFAKEKHVTLNTVLQSAWAVLLQRYSGASDIVFGATMSGRPPDLDGVENMLGVFINTLPIRLVVTPEKEIGTLLVELQKQILETRQYEYTPLSQIQRLSGIPRGRSLFESIFVVENYPFTEASQNWGQGQDIRFFQKTNYPLNFIIHPSSEIIIRICYDSSRFAKQAIASIGEHYSNALHAIAIQKVPTIQHVQILSPKEYHHVIVEKNPYQSFAAKGLIIPDMFDRQVEKTPNNIAVSFQGNTLTYRQLQERSNQVAHILQEWKAKPDMMVALFIEPSLEMIVAILGVLKSGAAYLPLDPFAPTDRLAFIMEDAEVSILITQPELQSRITNALPRSTHILVLDSSFQTLAGQAIDRVEHHLTDTNLAYVLFTSGSTGRPKGVLITHHNVARLFHATEAAYNFSEKDVWSVFHSYAFDVSVFEIFGGLFFGGKIVVVPYHVRRDPNTFYDLLEREQVTMLSQTPSAFRQLNVAEELREKVGALALRWIIFAGEALEFSSLRPWISRHGDEHPRIMNMYGITETTVHTTIRRVTQDEVIVGLGSMIGPAMPDLELYLLTPDLQPVPVGIPGEIYVGGDGVARGYFKRPELTQQKFLPNPFTTNYLGTLYRSGDSARHLHNGEIEFLGRLDMQVKIHGFRIELGEIESILREHPSVHDAVVIMYEFSPNDKRLVGYVVFRQHLDSLEFIEKTLSSIIQHAKQKLPEYMVPTILMPIEKLPLNINGKLDKKALPQPHAQRITEKNYVSPENPTEQAIAQIWQSALHLEKVGVEDNFFEIGGNSILLVQVYGKIRENLHLPNLALMELMEFPTIRLLCNHLLQPNQAQDDVYMRAEKQKASASELKNKQKRARQGLDD